MTADSDAIQFDGPLELRAEWEKWVREFTTVAVPGKPEEKKVSETLLKDWNALNAYLFKEDGGGRDNRSQAFLYGAGFKQDLEQENAVPLSSLEVKHNSRREGMAYAIEQFSKLPYEITKTDAHKTLKGLIVDICYEKYCEIESAKERNKSLPRHIIYQIFYPIAQALAKRETDIWGANPGLDDAAVTLAMTEFLPEKLNDENLPKTLSSSGISHSFYQYVRGHMVSCIKNYVNEEASKTLGAQAYDHSPPAEKGEAISWAQKLGYRDTVPETEFGRMLQQGLIDYEEEFLKTYRKLSQLIENARTNGVVTNRQAEVTDRYLNFILIQKHAKVILSELEPLAEELGITPSAITSHIARVKSLLKDYSPENNDLMTTLTTGAIEYSHTAIYKETSKELKLRIDRVSKQRQPMLEKLEAALSGLKDVSKEQHARAISFVNYSLRFHSYKDFNVTKMGKHLGLSQQAVRKSVVILKNHLTAQHAEILDQCVTEFREDALGQLLTVKSKNFIPASDLPLAKDCKETIDMLSSFLENSRFSNRGKLGKAKNLVRFALIDDSPWESYYYPHFRSYNELKNFLTILRQTLAISPELLSALNTALKPGSKIHDLLCTDSMLTTPEIYNNLHWRYVADRRAKASNTAMIESGISYQR